MADIRINALATTATTPASDDYLALDGAAQGTRKILATNIANNVTDVILGSSGPSVKSSLSARAPRQGLVFDGTQVAGTTSVPAFGTAAFTASAIISPTFTSNGTYIFGGASGAFDLFVDSSGVLNAGKVGVGAISSGTTLTAGKYVLVTYVRTSTSASGAVFYVNGVQVATVTDANDYTTAITLIGNAVTSTSAYQFVGGLEQPILYNRALSASEVVALYEAGAPAGADYNSASNTSIVTGFTNGGATGSNTYGTYSGASATGFTAATTGATGRSVSNTFSIINGNRYRVSFTLTLNSGSAPAFVYLTNGTLDIPGSNTPAAAAGSNTIDFTATATTASSVLEFVSTAASNFVISGLTLTRLGLLLAPDAAQAGNGYVWNDQSGNLAQIVLPSSGVQWNLPSVAGQRIRGTTSTNGNQQLLGASVLLPAECQITHVRARARSGTPTITIGTASGGAQIVASVALSTTWLNCTIALTGGIVSSADDIWIGSNSTDVVETDIAFQPLDF